MNRAISAALYHALGERLFRSRFSWLATVTCRTMNAAAPLRTSGLLRAVAAIVPAVLAASHVPNVVDAAHDRGACRVLGLHAQPWRALDVAVGALLAPLPLGTVAARAALGGALIAAAAGVLVFEMAIRLLRAWGEVGVLGESVAAIAAATALVAAPWQLEVVSVGSTATGATLILFTLWLVMRASEAASPSAWNFAAAAVGLAMGQEPSVFVSAVAASAAYVIASARGRSSLSRAWRIDKRGLVTFFAAGLTPFFIAAVRMRLRGSVCPGAALEPWGTGSPWSGAPLAFARQEIGPVLALLALAGAAMAARTERARPAAAGLTAVVAVGGVSGWIGAPMGPDAFAAPILAACAATAALSAVSMFAIVRAVARARVPLARTAAALFVVLELVLPVEAADEALARGEKNASGSASSWDDAAWGTLEPRTVVLVDDERIRERAAAADAQALLRSDVVIVGGKGQGGFHGGPFATDLVPLWRDFALSGVPSEASVSALASLRPLVASFEPAWGLDIGRHLLPMAILDRVMPEPRAASDRRRALDAFAAERQGLRVRLAGDAELCAATATLLRARAGLLTSLGDRELGERAAADARIFENP
jgi:hypothetical protein